MAVLLNVLALVLVLVLCWFGMQWLSARAHSRRDEHLDGDIEVDWEPPVDAEPCPECEGVGAYHRRGSLVPCTSCEGTGVHHYSA